MRILSALAVLLSVLTSAALDAAETSSMTASGGKVAFTFYHSNLRNAGLLLKDLHAADFQTGEVTLAIEPQSSLVVGSNEGFFETLLGGQLPVAAGLQVVAGGTQLLSENALLVPKSGTRDTLWLTNADGKHWFYLDYGHFELQGQTLHGRYMDVRIAADLAQMMGKPSLQGYLLGAASLQTHLNTSPPALGTQISAQPQGFTPACPVASPNWPTRRSDRTQCHLEKG